MEQEEARQEGSGSPSPQRLTENFDALYSSPMIVFLFILAIENGSYLKGLEQYVAWA